MKYLLLLISFYSYANTLPMSEVIKAIALEPGVGNISCSDKPDEECLSYKGIDWETAIIVEEIVDGAPIYNIKSETACKDEEDCRLQLSTFVCEEGFTAAYRLDTLQVYCYKLTGYEQVNTGKKVLKNDPDKLAAKAAKEAAKAARIEAIRQKKSEAKNQIKNINWNQVTTVAQLKAVVRQIVEKLDEEE